MTFQTGDAAPWDLDTLLINRGLPQNRRMGRVQKTTYATRAVAGFMQNFPSPGYDGRTFQSVVAAEAPFQGVRLRIRNSGPAFTINAACAGPTNAPSPNVNPSVLPMPPVLFGGSASVVVPAALATGAQFRPSIVTSDILLINSVARNDGGSLPLLCARAYYSTGPATGYGNTSLASQVGSIWNAGATGNDYNLGRPIQHLSAAGDFVTSNQSGFSGASPNANFGLFLAEFEFLHFVPAFTLTCLGDSITQGDTSSLTLLAPGHIACAAVSTQNRPVYFANAGISSQVTSTFVSRLQDLITAGKKPQCVLYSPWSPNDVGSQVNLWATEMALMRKNRAAVIELCMANDIYLIISTGIPRGYNATYSAIQVAFNNETLACQTYSGIDVVDYYSVMTDGNAAAAIIPAYTTEGLHPNDAGYRVMGAALAPVLQRVVNAYFN